MNSKHKNILLTGGRAFVTLELARHFFAAGHRVIVAESAPLHLCRYSRCVARNYTVPRPNEEPAAYIDALIALVRKENIDLLIPTCEEIFFVAQGLERLRRYCRVCVAPLAQLERLHSKWDFIQRAMHHGLTVPETQLLTSHDDLRQFLADNQRPFVLKPVYSRFATKVIVINHARQCTERFASLVISQEYPWVAQELLVGRAFCTYSIVEAGQLLAHAVYPVGYSAGRGTCIYFEPVEHPGIDAWVTRFLQKEQFSGQIAFDLIVTLTDTVYPLECNPRATSGIHLFHQLASAFLPEQDDPQRVLKPDPTARAMIAIAMLLYGPLALHSGAQCVDWLRKLLGTRDVIFAANDIKPFLSQPLLLWYNWRESRKHRISIQEFSTLDIEWNGPLPCQMEKHPYGDP